MVGSRAMAALACGVVLAVIRVPAAAPATAPLQIAFESNRDGSYQVYVMNPATALTH